MKNSGRAGFDPKPPVQTEVTAVLSPRASPTGDCQLPASPRRSWKPNSRGSSGSISWGPLLLAPGARGRGRAGAASGGRTASGPRGCALQWAVLGIFFFFSTRFS